MSLPLTGFMVTAEDPDSTACCVGRCMFYGDMEQPPCPAPPTDEVGISYWMCAAHSQEFRTYMAALP